MFKKKAKKEYKGFETFQQDGAELISCTCGKSKIVFIPVTNDKMIAMCDGCGDMLNIEPMSQLSIRDIAEQWNKKMAKKQEKQKR